MTGYPVKTSPAEAVLIAMALAAPMGVLAQDATAPDAALLEFLADWNAADGEWLDAELSDDAAEVNTPSVRVEKDHE